MFATLLNQGRSTLSNLICISGGQHQDWTADYRLYSKDRVDEQPLFSHIREKLLENLPPGQPLVVALGRHHHSQDRQENPRCRLEARSPRARVPNQPRKSPALPPVQRRLALARN